MNAKILFLDVDDTVCPSTRPVEAPMAAELNRLIENGHILAFISGSTVEQIEGQLGPALRGTYHLLGTSGTHYVRIGEGRRELIYHEVLPDAERERIVGLLRQLASRHGIRSLTTEADQIQDRGSQITFSAIGRHAPIDMKYAFDPDRKIRGALAEELRQQLGSAYQVGLGGTTSIDVTRQGLDKGWGIRQFLEHNHARAEDALFMGDNLGEGGNDRPAREVVRCIEVSGVEDTLMRLKSIQ